jgi:pyruvate formate lyase activating enzyme
MFLKGCPLRCLWCHSPESQEYATQILWLSIKCIGCLKCVNVCPTKARTAILPEEKDGKVKIVCDWSKCTNCGECEKVCLTKALYYCGVDYTIDELMPRIEREKPFYDKSGGGVTLSGGECLSQADGCAELLKRCKEIGVGTAVDTCGIIPYENIKKVLPYTDLFLYDLKHMDSERHAWGTAVPNERILENALKIAADGGKFHIRIPLIPGYNTSMENIEATRDFLLPIIDSVELIQVLPYHNLGAAKFDRLSTIPPELDTHAPTEDEVEEICAVFRDAGFEVIVH